MAIDSNPHRAKKQLIIMRSSELTAGVAGGPDEQKRSWLHKAS